MKIERRQLQSLLERSLETGDAAPLQQALRQTPAAELETFLSRVDAQKRRHVERLLGAPAPVTTSGAASGGATAGQRAHDLRAQKRQPWWGGVQGALPAPVHPEPTRDVDVHGERFTKDDIASLLRGAGVRPAR